MNKLLFVTVILIYSNFQCFSQIRKENGSTLYVAEASEQWNFPEIENYNGTFQFIVKEKKDFLFTNETFSLIENSRKLNEETILSLNPFLDVLIPSVSQLENPSFELFKVAYIVK
jgi:hypothetical protein